MLIRPMRSSFRTTHVETRDHWCCRVLISTAGVVCGLLITGCGTFVSPDVKRGDQHLAAGNWEEASVAYRQALKDDPFEPSLQNKYSVARERAPRRMMSEAGSC